MRSVVSAAVLSLVIEKPSWGGEIYRRLEVRYDGLLSPHRQHVYRALREIRTEGLIEPVELEAEDGSVRDGVRATAKGARAYRTWLREPVPVTSDALTHLMIRFASTRAEDIETARHIVEAYERVVLALGRGRAVRGRGLIERALDEERRAWVDARLRWVAWVRDELRTSASDLAP